MQDHIHNKGGSRGRRPKHLQITVVSFDYRKVTTSSLLVADFQIFRRLMKGKFDAYVQ